MIKLNIKTPGHADSRLLVRYLKKKLHEFSKEYKTVSEADVRLIHGPDRESDKVCEIYLKMPGKNIFAIQKAASFESAVLKAIAKLQSQINNITIL